MLVVTRLRPRIREQDENLADPHRLGECIEKQSSFGMEEMEVFQSGAVTLSNRANDPLSDDINTNAWIAEMSLRICRQKMAMSRAYFTNDLRRTRECHG